MFFEWHACWPIELQCIHVAFADLGHFFVSDGNILVDFCTVLEILIHSESVPICNIRVEKCIV